MLVSLHIKCHNDNFELKNTFKKVRFKLKCARISLFNNIIIVVHHAPWNAPLNIFLYILSNTVVHPENDNSGN